MAPIILLTPTDGTRPMLLTSPRPPVLPRWNKSLLVSLWTVQVLSLFLREWVCAIMGVIDMLGGNVLLSAFFIVNLVGNLAFMAYIFVEIHRYRGGRLEPRMFYEGQVNKLVFVGVGCLVMILRGGVESWVMPDLGILVIGKAVFVAPFIGGVAYAKKVLDEDLISAEEEERMEYITRRRHLTHV